MGGAADAVVATRDRWHGRRLPSAVVTAPFDPATGRATVDVVDTMVTVPSSREAWRETFTGIRTVAGTHDSAHPAGHLFRDLPEVDGAADFVDVLLAEMDRWGISSVLLPVAEGDEFGRRGVTTAPGRLHGVAMVDPNVGAPSIRAMRRLVDDGLAVAAAMFPAGTRPSVALDDPLAYPVYVAAAELDVPVLVNVGVPGPRLPFDTQLVERLDRVCCDLPELRIVTRHGGEPWEGLLVTLMRRHPNLWYSTSAFAPRHYPQAVVDYANDDGADRVIYAGYFPSGLSLERIFGELPGVPFAEHVWRNFLAANARSVFRLGQSGGAAERGARAQT